MPTITVPDPLVLPRIDAPADEAIRRPVARVVPAHHAIEGAGFEVWRPFPGRIDTHLADPFFLLDQLGPVEYGPNQAVGAPWHPHRGFETVTTLAGVFWPASVAWALAHPPAGRLSGVTGEGWRPGIDPACTLPYTRIES